MARARQWGDEERPTLYNDISKYGIDRKKLYAKSTDELWVLRDILKRHCAQEDD